MVNRLIAAFCIPNRIFNGLRLTIECSSRMWLESVLITSRLNAPLIQIIPDGGGSPTLPSSDADVNGLDDEIQTTPGADSSAIRAASSGVPGTSTSGDVSPNNQRRPFYTNESNRGYTPAHPAPRYPGDQQCRNSLPRVSLTSLGRAFTPRSSWNGSKAALLQLQRKSSRTDGGVPGYLAKKYHLTNASDRQGKEQVFENVFDWFFDYLLLWRFLTYFSAPDKRGVVATYLLTRRAQ